MKMLIEEIVSILAIRIIRKKIIDRNDVFSLYLNIRRYVFLIILYSRNNIRIVIDSAASLLDTYVSGENIKNLAATIITKIAMKSVWRNIAIVVSKLIVD